MTAAHGRTREQLATTDLLEQLEPSVAQRVKAQALRPSWGQRMVRWWTRHALSIGLVVVLAVGAGFLHGFNMFLSPDPNDDEATYVSQAWAFLENGELSHYTYWYDHPPVGWLLLAVWNRMVEPFDLVDLWETGRLGMLVVHVVSVMLLFLLARRLGLARWAATLAVVVFTVSPLGLDLTRLTLLDNIGTPWVLAGWVLALSPRRRLLAYGLAAVCLAMAVLIKETNALFIPAVILQIWFTTSSNRRFAVALTLALGTLLVAVYPLYALLKGELFEGEGHVSLIGALKWQLFDRPGGGWALTPGTQTNQQVLRWVEADWPTLAGGLVAAVLVFFVWRRGAWISVTYFLLVAMLFRGGYVPLPFPINLVWPAALTWAMAAQGIARRAATAVTGRPILRAGALALAGVAALAFGVRQAGYDERFLTEDRVSPYAEAADWMATHVSKDAVILADNDTWLRLVTQDGFDRDKVVWFYKMDTDPEVQDRYPNGWRDVDYVVVTGVTRIMAEGADYPAVTSAMENGEVVATFDQGVEIRRVRT